MNAVKTNDKAILSLSIWGHTYLTNFIVEPVKTGLRCACGMTDGYACKSGSISVALAAVCEGCGDDDLSDNEIVSEV